MIPLYFDCRQKVSEQMDVQKAECDKKNIQKFGNDKIYESPFDTYIFIPIAEKLVDPCYNIGLTPNMVTTLSKIFETLAIFFVIILANKLACLTYLVGYIFDCVDGRLARKYNMCSNFGMMYDFNSDMIAHFILFLVLLTKNGFYFSHVFLLFIIIQPGNMWYGLVQAINAVSKHHNDNFYEHLQVQLKNEKPEWFVKMFLMFHKSAYDNYKLLLSTYDDKKAHEYMKILQYLGPGTPVMFITLILFFDLGLYCRYTMQEILYFIGGCLNMTVFVTVPMMLSLLSAIVIYVCSIKKQKYVGKYVGLNWIYYSGLFLALLAIITAGNTLTMVLNVVLLMYHLYMTSAIE